MISLGDFLDRAASAASRSSLCVTSEAPAVAIDLSAGLPDVDIDGLNLALRGVPVVLVGVAFREPKGAAAQVAALADVVVSDPTAVLGTVREFPLASVALVLALRSTLQLDIPAALAVESAAYSVLQAGPEFARWKETRVPRVMADDQGAVVDLRREGGTVYITLNRPKKHNAFSTAMRDQLHDALLLPASDPSVERVVLQGAGPSFCSGGDLDEFGRLPDPATAHVTRLTRSAGMLVASLSDRVEARLHGACIGAGIELPAFAGRVVADPGTVISLPEVGLGLIPGAGGTVSLPRRIGRQRTAELALTRAPIDANTARSWGLVDEVARVEPAT
jgi:enoyl-CoA hydratase/carnithine racemase